MERDSVRAIASAARRSRKILATMVFAGLLPMLLPSTGAAAESGFPQRPVRLVIPTSPGGGVDFIARLIGQQIGERWGQTVVADNRAGAAGLIGLDLVARAAPDGHTLVLDNTGHLLTAQLTGKLGFELTPIALPAASPLVFVVTPGLPATSLREFIALVRSRPPGDLNFASAGEGSSSHLGTELFASLVGIRMTHVPYKGTGPGLPDLLSGKVHATLTAVAPVLAHVQAGRLRALAVTGSKRDATLAQVPTFAEAGHPQFRMSIWYGVFGPPGMAPALVSRINADINWAVRQPAVAERLAAAGVEAATGTPAQLAEFMSAEVATWRAALDASGMR